jgi:hypothetical protein
MTGEKRKGEEDLETHGNMFNRRVHAFEKGHLHALTARHLQLMLQ